MTNKLATLGAGCFWGVESLLSKINGVLSATSGYAGGKNENPTYEQVCTGQTGHAEVVQIEFDENIITFTELLNYFFRLHDPTTPNQQGVDIGTQYRSVIFYHDEKQKNESLDFINKLEEQKKFSSKIVTEVSSFSEFYRAEEYHQKYYEKKYQGGTGPIFHYYRDL